jgi:antirestriction protein ArdC
VFLFRVRKPRLVRGFVIPEGQMANRPDIYADITNPSMAAFEPGPAGKLELPWIKAASNGIPTNAITGRKYRGVNVLSLWCAAQRTGFSSQRWASYRQWRTVGAQVRAGERASTIVFFKEISVEPADEDDDGRRLIARASWVFNADQVEGWMAPEPEPRTPSEPIAAAEAFVAQTNILIRHEGNQACYVPCKDEILMPAKAAFRSIDAYYAVLAHELTHASGHPDRLNRDLRGRFGSEAYAMEELVAELGSAFLMADLGLSATPRSDHAA